MSFRSIGRSALILTGSAAAVQVIGIIREVFVAAQVGLSSGYDALLVALIIPTTLAGVLTAGTATAMVPAYLEVRAGQGLDAARRLAGVLVVWIGASGLALWLLLALFGPAAIAVAGPGLEPAARDAATSYLGIVAPLAFVSGVSAILAGICQAEERFKVLALSSFTGAGANLAATLLLWQPLGLDAIALANLLGPLLATLVVTVGVVRSSHRPRLTLWTSREELGAFARHAAPLTLSSAILQLNGIVDRAIATLIGPGAVSALRYADVLVRTPIGAISPAWSTALYPSLVRVATEATSGLGAATSRALRYVVVAFVPIAILTVAVAPVAVAVGFGRGAFTESDVAVTAVVVAAFAPMLVVAMCYPPFTGALNARRRGGVLLAGGVINVALNLVLDILFGLTLGAAGVALASSVTAIVILVFFARRVARVEPDFQPAPLGRVLVRSIAASTLVAVPIGWVSWTGLVPRDVVGGVLALAAFGVLGLLAYLFVALRLGIDEARELRDRLRELLPLRTTGG